MAYSTDFKQRALDYIKEGNSHVEAAKVFDVGVRTLFTWEKNLREQGHLERKKRVVKNRKIPLEELKSFVEAHPDAFLREIAAHFDCAIPSVWAALKQMKVTSKKDDEL
ncbi:transposase [Streptococcus pseudopneumoniae]|nr:transposase [Streptococcus pseudopneumoniae]TMR62322.1 transposase [Streptococcus pseudopneumoniae]